MLGDEEIAGDRQKADEDDIGARGEKARPSAVMTIVFHLQLRPV
jgi:hypothetical protein